MTQSVKKRLAHGIFSRWFIPVLTGMALAIYVAAGVQIIQLSPVVLDTRLVVRGLLGFVAGVPFGLGLVWLCSQVSRWRIPARQDLPVWLLGGLILVMMAEVVVRIPYVDRVAWTAMRARISDEHMGFLRGASRLRSLMADVEAPANEPRLILVGSSQMNYAVQPEQLVAGIPAARIESWTMAAMVPLRMLMIGHLIRPQSGDTVVVYWSEFDIGVMTDFEPSWFRPLANVHGLRELLYHVPSMSIIRSMTSALDLGLASISELWSMRDIWHLLVTAAAGASPAPTPSLEHVMRVQQEEYARGLLDDAYFSAGLKAASTLVEGWRRTGAKVLILEGSVNPWMYTAETFTRRQVVRDYLTLLAEQTGATYIPVARQEFQPTAEDWRDGTHLTQDASAAFTAYLVRLMHDAQAHGGAP